MLKPLQNSQHTKQLSKIEKQVEQKKESTSGQSTVAGQELASPLSDFLNEAEMNAIIPDDAQQTEQSEQSESTEALVEITEEIEASAEQIDQEELVAELLETVTELQIEEEQLDVFAPMSTDDAADRDTAMENLVEAVVETMAETSVETLVNTFVETEDIAKIVSSTTLVTSTKSVMNLIGKKMVEKTVMLLKNGMAYTDLTTPPEQLEIPSSLESAVGSAWTTWRQDEETGAIYLGSEDTGGETRLTGVEIDLEPLSIEDIAGTHTKVEATAWSATHQTKWSDVIFHEDGTFEYAVTTVRTTGGYDTHWVESFSQSATYLSANRPVINADGTEEPSNGSPRTNMFGSFKLAEDGLSIELTYANGSVESRLIYKKDGRIHFGEKSFTTRLETKDQLAQSRERLRALGDENVLGADWLAVIADSAEAANDNRDRLRTLIHAASTGPSKG